MRSMALGSNGRTTRPHGVSMAVTLSVFQRWRTAAGIEICPLAVTFRMVGVERMDDIIRWSQFI